MVDAPRRWTAEELRRAMNALLPEDIWVAEASVAAPDFHPRFDATDRSYRIGLAPEAESPFHARWCWALDRPVEIGRMREAAEAVVGDHSFLAFARSGQEQRGDRCIVRHASWQDWPLGIEFHVSANRFLHHMVRYLVGTMVEIGAGKREAGDMRRLLDPTTTLVTSPPAPPQGLYLTRVIYSGEAGGDDTPLPAPPRVPSTESTGSR